MTGTGRRELLRIAAASMLLPLCSAWGAPAFSQSSRFAPPDRPMLYTRRLRREMADGAAFTVTRSFAVRFEAHDTGFRVDGEQVEVAVDAPEQLAPFAQIERERREAGLFPLTLDARGHIHGSPAGSDSTHLEAAVREVTARLDTLELSGAEREELRRFVTALHQSAATLVTKLPPDLFAPGEPERATTKDVALPGGEAGVVTIRFKALTDAGTGLMREAEREVVTDLSGDRRRTVESWTLTPL